MYPGYNFLSSASGPMGYLQQIQGMQQPQMPPIGQPQPQLPPAAQQSAILGQSLMSQQPQAPQGHQGGGMSPLMFLSPLAGLMGGRQGLGMFLSPIASMMGAFK